MTDKVHENVRSHTITEYLHTPEHDQRKETLEFKNAKHELEIVEHLGCFKCRSMNECQSHHIIERSWAQGINMDKVAWLLFNFRDYHGHCKRDFKNEQELAAYLRSHKTKEEALDSLYNQLILCKQHHVGEGLGIHEETAPTFDASLVMEDDFLNALTKEQYEQMKEQLKKDHEKHK